MKDTGAYKPPKAFFKGDKMERFGNIAIRTTDSDYAVFIDLDYERIGLELTTADKVQLINFIYRNIGWTGFKDIQKTINGVKLIKW